MNEHIKKTKPVLKHDNNDALQNRYIITTFYKFINIEDVESVRFTLYKVCKENGILGTVLLANEGINATLVGAREAIDIFYASMNSLSLLADIKYKETFCEYKPFSKLKVKIKPEIIKFNITDLDINNTGKLLNVKEWDQLLESEATIIDCRNDYEVALGTFKNALNPKTRNFTDLTKWLDENLSEEELDKPIGMFCTGGVRCEKSTAYLKQKGYKNVYHLDGGIIRYIIETGNEKGYWKKWCFVFDDRVAIDYKSKPLAREAKNA